MSKSIKNFFIIAAMAAIVLCVGCQKNNSDIDETKAQVSQVSPAVWERSESETRTYNVIAKEHADELRKNESDWLTTANSIRPNIQPNPVSHIVFRC